MEEPLRWAALGLSVIAILWNVGVFRWSARKEELKSLDARIDGVEASVRKHEKEGSASRERIAERLTVIEGSLKHLPDQESSQRMEVAVTRLEGRLEVLNERLQPVSAISERLQDFLLEQAKSNKDSL